jgi:membrane-bound lytic murein transglycosylase A
VLSNSISQLIQNNQILFYSKIKSFVFFEILKKSQFLGAQGITLTPGYSLVIDRGWMSLGAPLWLATKKPLSKKGINKTFQRLMIAQDTGGAIRGVVRDDIYWGTGKKATYLGEHMKNEGRYWLLLPNHVVFKAIENYTKHKKSLIIIASHSLQWLAI